MRKYRPVIAVTMVFLFAGCRDGAEVQILAASLPLLPGTQLSVTLVSNGREISYTEKDFTGVSAGGTNPVTPFVNTGNANVARLEVTVRSDQHVVATRHVEFGVARDWWHTVVFTIDTEDPTISCFGCNNARRFVIHPQFQFIPADSLWIYIT